MPKKLDRALTALSSAVLLAGCAGPRDEEPRLGSSSDALAVVVSAELDLEGYPALTPSGSVVAPKVACGPDQCLVAYTQGFFGTIHLLVTRVAANGMLLDSPRIDLGVIDKLNYAVTSNGAGEYAVAWTRQTGVMGARVRASDGKVLDTPAATIAAEGTDDVLVLASTGTSYLFAINRLQGPRARLWKGGLVTGDVALPKVPSTIVAGPLQYLLAWDGGAIRINESTGLAIGSAFTFTKYTLGPTTGAFFAGNYLLVWPNQSNLYALRIRASDGQVLDPDDEFNALTGAHVISTQPPALPGIGPKNVKVLDSGGVAAVMWQNRLERNGPIWVYGARVDPATATRIDGQTATPEFDVVQFSEDFGYDMAMGTGVGLFANRSVAAPLVVTASPYAVHAPAPTAYAWTSQDRRQPIAASNGTDFLVLWALNYQVMGSRVDGKTGQSLDDPPLLLGMSQGVIGLNHEYGVAAVGNDYLVAFRSGANVERRLVKADGTVGPLVTPALGASQSWPSDIKVVSNERYAAVSWDAVSNDDLHYLEGNRVDPVTLAAAEPMAVSLGFGHGFGYRGGNYALLADTAPPPERRTFLTVFNGLTDISAVRYRSELGAVLDPTVIENGNAPGRLFGAGNGTDLVAWWMANATLRTAVIDATSGLAASGYPKQLFGLGMTVGWPEVGDEYFPEAIWFDGRSYLMALRRTFSDAPDNVIPRNPVTFKRYATDMTPLEGPSAVDAFDGFTVLGKWNDQAMAAASDGHGRSLVVYAAGDLARFGTAIKARFVDNDGTFLPDGGTADADARGEAAISADGGDAVGAGGSSDANVGTGGSEGGPTGGAGGMSGGAGGDGDAMADVVGGRGGTSSGGGTQGTAGGSALAPPSSHGVGGGGCGCRTGRSRQSTNTLLVALMLAGAAISRRGSRRGTCCGRRGPNS
jgi:hypothetical protein